MGRALDIAAVTLRHGLAVMDLMGADPVIAGARKIWEWLERGRRRRATSREAFNALRGTIPRMKLLSEALEALKERGYVQVKEDASPRPGRPPSPTILVRPELAEGWE